jgi:putative membrane-bound dehydrogenase-like protein
MKKSISFFFLVSFLIISCSTKVQHELTFDNANLFLPEDLEATIWAESPMFYNPTNMDVDHKGRIWITEAVNYRSFRNDSTKRLHHSPGDRIIILEDKDGDGVAESSKVFVQDKDLVAPLGIAIIENKVIVSCSPSVIIYTDEDGDDVPDKKEVFLTGFGGYDHDHGLHSVVAGPDGKWYLNAGNAGPHIVTDKSGWTLRSGSLYNGGTPYNNSNTPGLVSDDGKIWVGGVALRINPDGSGLEVMGHNFRNAYELIVDSFGNMWQNDNDDEIQSCRVSLIMEKGNAGYTSPDGSRSWQADRRPGQNIQTAHWHQQDPGVMPVGDVTGAGSPTGVAFYEGDELGPQYRGILLSADAGRNVIFAYKPEPDGACFNLSNRSNFIASVQESNENYIWDEKVSDTKKWFRPSDVTIGTDGAIYISDWYDPIVGGHSMHDTIGFGRIYRIAPKNKKLTNPILDLSTIEGQIKALLNPAVNVRYSGYSKLRAAGDQALSHLKNALKTSNPYHRARILWLLAEHPEGIPMVEAALDDTDTQIRVTAIRAIRNSTKLDDQTILKLSNHQDPALRREIAFVLRDKPYMGVYKEALLNITRLHDGKDRAYLEAIGAAAEGKENEFYKDLIAIYGNDPLLWNNIMVDVAWRLHPLSSIKAFLRRAQDQNLTFDERERALIALGFINHNDAAQAMMELTKNPSEEIALLANWWITYKKTNDWFAYELKGWKMPSDNLIKNPELISMKNNLLDTVHNLSQKIEIAKKMAEDQQGLIFLLGMTAKKQLSQEIKEAVKPYVLQNSDRTLQALVKHYFNIGSEDNYDPGQILKQGDAVKGKMLFAGNCGYCHKINEKGAETGPELSAIKMKYDERGLLDAIIYPNKGIEFGYEPVLVTTKDGGAVIGFVYTNGKVLLLKSHYGQSHYILRENVELKVNLKASIMPDPEIMSLKQEDLSDIIKYLMSI